MSRRSCSGGRPKSRALPRRSKRQAARTGSINSQRASDRSLGYGRRFAASPLAELTAMLHVLAEPGHHPQLAGWAGDV
ncbi:DUF5937 family protein, partial [Streptomyces sp. NPDC005728]|uniref:DUF5937 family protein n=1 Tax=Streptomyces sp. NPDC005728 TaxID=3157054 RepID=UPI0033E1CA38